MLRYDHSPSQRRDAIAQRQAMLDTIVAYRFLTPLKIAADERRDQAMAYAALSQSPGRSTGMRRSSTTAARRRLGAIVVAIGMRLQGHAAAGFDPQPDV